MANSNLMNPNTSAFQPQLQDEVVAWLDRELNYELRYGVSRRVDLLLDLRRGFSGQDLTEAVLQFYEILPVLTAKNPLLSQRLRHWISQNCEVVVSGSNGSVGRFQITPQTRNLRAFCHQFCGENVVDGEVTLQVMRLSRVA